MVDSRLVVPYKYYPGDNLQGQSVRKDIVTPSGDTTGATDSGNISAALADNASSNIPIAIAPGTYWVNQTIDLTRDYIQFSGGGRGRTNIVAAVQMDAVIKIDNNLEAVVTDLTIDGNNLANHELSMVHSEGTTRHSIERVRCRSNHRAPVNNTSGDGSITTGTVAFTSASGTFTAADIGRWLLIQGAATGGTQLFAQITAFTNAQSVTLDRNAGATVTTANYQVLGFAIHNNGCEDVAWYKVGVDGSEGTPGSLKPQMLLNHFSGLGTLLGCDIFGPVFYDTLSLEIVGCNIGPLVSVNQAGSQSKQVHVSQSWIYDGGTPTSYRPIDTATTFLSNITLDACHLVAALASGWCNGRLPTGNRLHLKECVYVQSAGNANSTMNLFATSSATRTTLIVDGGKLSIGGSMTTLQINSGGSATHTVEIRGYIDGATTYTNTTTNFNAPAIPASTTAQRNDAGSVMAVYVLGGTVTGVAVDGVATGLTSGLFIVRPMSTITLTYSVAPTWVWQAL